MKKHSLLLMLMGMLLAMLIPGMAFAADGSANCELEVGTGHEAVMRDIVVGLNESEGISDASVSGTTIRFTTTFETNGEVLKVLKDALIGASDYDNGEHNSGYVSMKTPDSYKTYQDYADEQSAKKDDPIKDGQTYYAIWEKLIDAVSVTVDDPKCGTEVDEELLEPLAEVKLNSKNISLSDGTNLRWYTSDAKDAEFFTGKMKGGETVYARVALTADFGYFFHSGNSDAKATEIEANGEKVSEFRSSGPGVSFFVPMEVKHVKEKAKKENVKKPTCTKAGSHDEVVYCKGCGKKLSSKTVSDKATGHNWGSWKVTKKATVFAKGEKQRNCKNDASHVQKKSIPKLKVTGTLLAKASTKGDSAMTLSWTKVKNVDGYDVYFGICNHGYKTIPAKKAKSIKGNSTFQWTKSGLKAHTPYKAYVKAWVKKGGKKTYVKTSPMVHVIAAGSDGAFVNPKSVKVGKTSLTLKKGKSAKISATVTASSGKKLLGKEHAAKLRFYTSNAKVASVSASGKITAKGKGSCKVYILAVDGTRASVKVKVK